MQHSDPVSPKTPIASFLVMILDFNLLIHRVRSSSIQDVVLLRALRLVSRRVVLLITLLEKSDEVLHNLFHNQLRFTLNQDVQLRWIARTGFFTLGIVSAFVRNGAIAFLKELDNIAAIRSGPAGALAKVVDFEGR